MSKQYSATSFGMHHEHLTEARVRALVQEEVENFFYGMKDELENKIKDIDQNIFDLRNTLGQLKSTL
jgi:hypothetical protein